MAERMISVKLLDDITECPVCTESYTDPRSLPCVHTFCLRCIAEWSGDKLSGENVKCPLCRSRFRIPRGGIGNLPKNIFVAKLLAMKEPPSHTSTKLCGPCSANRTRSRDEVNKAVAFCVDCQENLCENCRYIHSKLTMSRTHRIISVKELFNTPTTCPSAVCDKHPQQDLELFCVDCQEALCMVCLVTQHFGHKSDKITQIVSSFRQDISKNITELQQTSLQTITQDLKNVQDRRRKCVESFSVVEKEVCARADELKATIEQHKQQLLIQLTKVKTRKLKDIDNTIYEITQDKALLESFIKYSEEMLQKGSDGDIAIESKNLKLTSMEMKRLCEKNREIQLSETAVTFTPSEDAFERRRGNCVNWVGSLSGFSTKLCPSLKLSLKGDEHVTAVCSLNGQLFVTRFSIKEISVYDTSTLTLQRNITASVSSGSLWGLAACTTNNCLYVADTLRNTIYRMDLQATDLEPATKWSVASCPNGLSVNSSHNLLVACWNAKKIQEYNTNGSLIREISDRNCLYHAIERSRGTVVVSQTGQVHGVSVKSTNGRDINTYGSTTRGSGPGQMDTPRSLAVDSKGFIIVADCNNNRILVLNPELTEARPLPMSRDVKLNDPVALCYEESLGHLYVGDRDKLRLGLVLVFNNVFNLSSLFSQ